MDLTGVTTVDTASRRPTDASALGNLIYLDVVGVLVEVVGTAS